MELDRQMESELKTLCCISFGCTYRILAQVLEFISLSLSLPLFQLFLTWMCSVICFPHSTETGTAEGWVSGGRGEGEIRGCLCWCCCWKKCSSNDSLQICIMWSPTPPHRRIVTINIFTVLKCSDTGQKELEKLRETVQITSRNSSQFWKVMFSIMAQHLGTAHIPVCTSQDIPLHRIS